MRTAAALLTILVVLATVWLIWVYLVRPPETMPVPRTPMMAFEGAVADRLARDRPPTVPLPEARVELRDVQWDDPVGRPLFRARSVVGLLDLYSMLRGDILAEDVAVHAPVVHLERRPGEPVWNHERWLAMVTDRPTRDPTDPPMRFLLRHVSLVDGMVQVTSPEVAFRAAALNASLPRVLLAAPALPGPEVDLARLATTLSIAGVQPALPVLARDGRFRVVRGDLRFAVAGLDVRGSAFTDARGIWRPALPGLGLDAVVRAERLELADLAALVPELPVEEGTARFVAEISPRPDARTAVELDDLIAEALGSRAVGALSLLLGGPPGLELAFADLRLDPLALAVVERVTGPLPYAGQIVGGLRGPGDALAFAGEARLSAPGVPAFRIGVDAGFALEPITEPLLRYVVATFDAVPLLAFRPLLPPLPESPAPVTGLVALRGPPDRVPAEIEAELAIARGTVSLDGILDLTGRVPVYQADGRIIGVQLEDVFGPDVPPVALTAAYQVSGRAFDLQQMVLDLALRGQFTGWQAGPDDTVAVRAALDRGVLALDTVTLALSTLELQAGGRWRLLAPGEGAVEYRLAVSELLPWGPFLPFLEPAEARGAIRSQGTLSGTLDRLRLAGTAQGLGVRYDGWAASRVEGDFDLVFDEDPARFVVDATAENLHAPLGDFTTAEVAYRQIPPRFTLDARGERVDHGHFAAAVDGLILPDATREATLRVLELEFDRQRWSLVAPGFLRFGGPDDEFTVRNLVLAEVDADGRIALDGTVFPDEADLQLVTEALPVGAVQAWLGRRPVLTGELWSRTLIRGTAAEPAADVTFRLMDGEIEELEFTRIEGEAVYSATRLNADAVAVLDEAVLAEVDAEVPMVLAVDWPPGIQLLEDQPLRVALVADSLPLEVIAAMTPDMQDARGTAAIRAEIGGTMAAPVLDGRIVMVDGAATFPAVNQRYDMIAADIELRDRLAVIRELRARSDGWAQVVGTIRFDQLTSPVFEIAVVLDEFRAVGAEDRRGATFTGEVRVAGPVNRLVLSGRVLADDGDIELPDFAGDGVDLGLAAEEPVELPPEPEPTAVFPVQPAPALPGLVVDRLVVEAGNNLWFSTNDIRLRLSGEVTVFREQAELRLLGTLSGDRGTFILRAGPIIRRFDVVAAEVRFLGTSPPDPLLDVVASRIIPAAGRRRIEVQLRVGGTLAAPTLALTTPDLAPIPETELLSLVLFGQPGLTLGEGLVPGEPVLEQILVGGLTELATLELEAALLTDLGLPLEIFQIRALPGPIPLFGAPVLVFGVEIAPDVFLTVDAGLGDLFGPTEAVTVPWTFLLEWRIDREWTLEAGYRPVHATRLLHGLGVGLPVGAPERQFTVDVRRRWTY